MTSGSTTCRGRLRLEVGLAVHDELVQWWRGFVSRELARVRHHPSPGGGRGRRRRARTRLDAALVGEQSADLIEFYSATRSTVRRLQHEFALDERVRRQLRLVPQRRRPCRSSPLRRPHPEAPPPARPDADTEVLPQQDEPPEDGC